MTESHVEHIRRTEERRVQLAQLVEELFPNEIRLTLEIGSGHGHWLVDYAELVPDRFCLGIDIIRDRVERAEKKRMRKGLENLRFIRAEAMELISLLPSRAKLDQVFVLFPDPWPKKRHWKKRLINVGFLNDLAERCSSSVQLCFRTDHTGYFEWATEILAEHPLWEIESAADWPFERETVFQAKADGYQSLVAVRKER